MGRLAFGDILISNNKQQERILMNTTELEKIYMHTAKGSKYYPFAPKPQDVHIYTIAHHLATIGRWNGATLRRSKEDSRFDQIFYSVAEHSVYVWRYVCEELGRPDLGLYALLHDAAEAYVSDLIRPLKYSTAFFEPFKRIEEINERAIAERFNLTLPFPEEIKIADDAVCAAEASQIIVMKSSEDWEIGKMYNDKRIAPYIIEMLEPTRARDLFLDTYKTQINS